MVSIAWLRRRWQGREHAYSSPKRAFIKIEGDAEAVIVVEISIYYFCCYNEKKHTANDILHTFIQLSKKKLT